MAPPLENYVLASNVRRPSSSVRHLQYVVPSTNNFGNVDWKQNLWWPLRILNWPRKIRVCVFSFWNAHKSHHLHSNFQISVSNFEYGYLVFKRLNTEKVHKHLIGCCKICHNWFLNAWRRGWQHWLWSFQGYSIWERNCCYECQKMTTFKRSCHPKNRVLFLLGNDDLQRRLLRNAAS